jgi:glutamate racemase
VRTHVAALLARLPAPQAAVLGCTHYPLVEDAFRAALPPGTALVSQPALVSDSLADYLRRHPNFAGGDGVVRYLTTGDPVRVGARAAAFLGASVAFEPTRTDPEAARRPMQSRTAQAVPSSGGAAE